MIVLPLLFSAIVALSPDDVVAKVDEITITRAALQRRIEAVARMGKPLGPEDALDSLVVDALLSQEARRMGLRPGDVAPFVEREARAAAGRAFVESMGTRAAADEAALRAAFHASSDFVRYEFLAYETQEQAQAAALRIQRGSSFSSEARTALDSQLYPNASEAPAVLAAQLGPARERVMAAKPGTVVGPLERGPAWIVLRVLWTQIGTEAEFAAKRPQLAVRLREQAVDAERQHLVAQLKAKEDVKIDETFLRELPQAEPTREQLQHVIATVKGAPVRYADVYPRVLKMGGPASHMASASVKVQLATQVVDERVLHAFAIERGFDKVPEVVAQRAELERNALGTLCAERIRAAAPAPSEREIEQQYRQHAAEYGSPLAKIRPRVAADAAELKRRAALDARLGELRRKASVSLAATPAAAAGR